MEIHAGKPYMAFAMSKIFGPVLAFEFAGKEDGSLSFIKRLDNAYLDGVNLERKFKTTYFDLSSDPTSLCHGREVRLTSSYSNAPCNLVISGIISPVKFKSIKIKRENAAGAKELIIEDVDCLFFFDPDELNIPGVVREYVTISAPGSSRYTNFEKFEADIQKYIENLQEAVQQLKQCHLQPNMLNEDLLIDNDRQEYDTAFQYNGKTLKVGVDVIRYLVNDMLREHHFSIIRYENAVEKRNRLREELAVLDKFIDGENK